MEPPEHQNYFSLEEWPKYTSNDQEITYIIVFMQTRSIMVFFLGIIEEYFSQEVCLIFLSSTLELRFSPIYSNF